MRPTSAATGITVSSIPTNAAASSSHHLPLQALAPVDRRDETAAAAGHRRRRRRVMIAAYKGSQVSGDPGAAH
jgi:hypothetical protein